MYKNIPWDLSKNTTWQRNSYLSSLILKPDLNNTNAKTCFPWKFFSNLFSKNKKTQYSHVNGNNTWNGWKEENIYAFFYIFFSVLSYDVSGRPPLRKFANPPPWGICYPPQFGLLVNHKLPKSRFDVDRSHPRFTSFINIHASGRWK